MPYNHDKNEYAVVEYQPEVSLIEKNKPAISKKAPKVKRIKPFEVSEKSFDILVNSISYKVRTLPFLFNDELRFRVTINDLTEHMLVWDSENNQLQSIDDEFAIVPAGLEIALSEKLLSM